VSETIFPASLTKAGGYRLEGKMRSWIAPVQGSVRRTCRCN